MLKVFSTLASLVFTLSSARLSKHMFSDMNDVIMPPLADNSTYGNTEEIRTTNVHLNLTVDFDARVLDGWAYHDMEVVSDTDIVQFDIWDLTIDYCLFEGSYVTFTILQPNPLIGSVLQVQLPRTLSTGETVMIGVKYTTSPTGQAFSWLNAE